MRITCRESPDRCLFPVYNNVFTISIDTVHAISYSPNEEDVCHLKRGGPVDRYRKSNRELWDKLTYINANSEMYDLEEFKRGKCTLDEIEVKEVGDVSGKSLLHLQCHFGQDTISWARRGAKVTGVDFSGEAVSLARELAEELGVEAEFILSDVYDLPEKLDRKFDVVFTSAGVLVWLPDLKEWGQVIGSLLKPGGAFYIREFHPTAYIFDDEDDSGQPRIRYPYFGSEKPLELESIGSYADKDSDLRSVSFEWPHSMSDIVNSLIKAGMRIDFLNEFPFTTHDSHLFLTRLDSGRWIYRDNPQSIPFMFSIKATKL